MKKVILSIALMTIGNFAMAQEVTPAQKPANRAEMKQKMQHKEQERMAQMQKDLNLSQDQVDKIKALNEKRKAEMKAEFDKNKDSREAKMKEMKAKHEQMDAEMKNILTPQQYEKWKADRKAKMEQHKAEMKGRVSGDKMHRKPMETAVEPAN